MVDFKQIFDIKSIDDYQLGHLAWVLNSPSYLDVFEPYLRKRRDDMALLLLDRSQQRKDMYPDDFLCGGIVMVDGLLELFSKLITETDMEKIHRSQITLTENQIYDKERLAGNIHPMVKPVKDYDDETDF